MVIGGVYKQVDLFKRDGYLYAKAAGGFVRLYADGATTKAKMRLDALSWEGDLYSDPLGKLCSEKVTGAKLLSSPVRQKLLGAP